jgi:peroxiredoxin
MHIKKFNNRIFRAKQLLSKQLRNSWMFLLVGTIVLVTAACGSAQAAASDNTASMGMLSGASSTAPQKMENAQPENAQPAGGEGVQDPGGVPIEQGVQPTQVLAVVTDAPILTPQVEAVVAEDAAPANQQPAPVPVEDLPPAEPSIGFLAPDFTLQTLDGRTVSLSDFRGRPVVINYWASWCVPCQAELPILESIYQDYQQHGIVILSVNAIEQDNMGDVQGTVTQHALTYPVLLDESEQVWSTYRMLFFPTSLMVDSNGIIREIVLGDTTEENFRAKVDQLIAGNY